MVTHIQERRVSGVSVSHKYVARLSAFLVLSLFSQNVLETRSLFFELYTQAYSRPACKVRRRASWFLVYFAKIKTKQSSFFDRSSLPAPISKYDASRFAVVHVSAPDRSLLRHSLRGGYNYDSTAIRRAFYCSSEVIKVTATQPASRSRADLLIYVGRSAAARS